MQLWYFCHQLLPHKSKMTQILTSQMLNYRQVTGISLSKYHLCCHTTNMQHYSIAEMILNEEPSFDIIADSVTVWFVVS